jgi:hypothetical protein
MQPSLARLEGWTIARGPSPHAAEISLPAAFRVKVPIQFSNSSRQLTPSLPGIAVRRTASLPLAYARQSICFENGLAKMDGCPGHLARRGASRFCLGMTRVETSRLQTHSCALAAPSARAVDESSAQRGRGERRMPVAPAASCALGIGRTHTSNNEYPGITRRSRTQWF